MRNRWISGAAFLFAATMATSPSTALAQDDKDVEVRGKRVVIEIDDDGRVTVDGKTFSEGDRTVILRVRPDDGELEIERVGPGRRMLREYIEAANPRGNRVHFRYGSRAPDVWVDAPNIDFEPMMRSLEPMLEDFHFEFADPLRRNAREHREVAELERESRELAREARQAEGAERARIEADLRKKLGEIYEKKMELRRDRVQEMEKKIESERDALQKRSEARSQMIDRRFRMLLGEGDVLDW